MNSEDDGLRAAIALMALSARTAPKGKGMDSIVTRIVPKDELPALAAEMKAFGEKHNIGFFLRDAGNIAASGACLIIGARGHETLGINCQGCGYPSCAAMAEACKDREETGSPFSGPNCVLKMADLGIAVGSAVKSASIHNLDNRVMYSAGVAARSLGMVPGCSVAYGIPVSATGKNIFFDRHQEPKQSPK
ncbi:MAG: hypothetical protein GKC05_01860 [Methanomicrobiales archaeon]|nr:hypothetical protein [Methanomicrobiales archaeon]NYT21223.1 hypothetical protein [Methanomicrobiales archaeon]